MARPYLLQGQVAIPAGITPNVIALLPALERFIRNKYDSEASFSAVQSGAGLLLDVGYGSKNTIDQCPLRVGTVLREQFDTINDGYYPPAGSLNFIRANNTTGAPITLNFQMNIQPLDPNQGEGRMPDKIIMGVSQSIPANTADVNVIGDRRYEYPPLDSVVSIFDTASAAGLTRRFEVESETLSPDNDVNPANTFPIIPDDLAMAGIEVEANSKMLVPVSNDTGGALTYQALIQLQEMFVSGS